MRLFGIPIILITTNDKNDGTVEKELEKRNLKISHTVLMKRNKNHEAGVAEGHLRALSIYNPPFIILEDDVRVRDVGLNFDIPEIADCVYLGLSTWGLDNLTPKDHASSYKTIDENIVRIYNMLSTHSILYNSKLLVKMVKQLCYYSILNLKPFDVEFAMIQKYFNVMGLTDPLFYQSGYNEYCTNFKLQGVL